MRRPPERERESEDGKESRVHPEYSKLGRWRPTVIHRMWKVFSRVLLGLELFENRLEAVDYLAKPSGYGIYARFVHRKERLGLIKSCPAFVPLLQPDRLT